MFSLTNQICYRFDRKYLSLVQHSHVEPEIKRCWAQIQLRRASEVFTTSDIAEKYATQSLRYILTDLLSQCFNSISPLPDCTKIQPSVDLIAAMIYYCMVGD